jgi:hypothetical protein
MDTRVIVDLTGAISTNMDQSKETGQLEWQDVESHHTVSASSIVGGEAPPVQHKLHAWPDLRQESPVDMRKQIFCNRSLNMKSIVAVGFDMDYTLAQYKPETFESMAYTGTIQKLVNDLGYPKELLDWKFDWKYMVRGLVLDKKRGSILKDFWWLIADGPPQVCQGGISWIPETDKGGTSGHLRFHIVT